jgi:hypothetical protein
MCTVVPMSDAGPGECVEADLTVRVPRDGGADLAAGVAAAVERVAGVAAVEAVEVTGLTPTLNAVRTDATARLRLGTDETAPESAATTLESGFGVEARDVRAARGGDQRPNRVDPAGPGADR